MKEKIFLSGLLEKEEMREVLQTTGAGLESIRFGISDNLDHLKGQIMEARENLEYYGHPKLYLHGPFLDLNPMSYDSAIRKVTMDRFNACYEAAVELGAEGIVFHSCMIPQIYFTIGWAERMADFWNEFLEGKRGIPVRMENVLDRDVDCFADVAKAVEHPDFGLCLDIGHAYCYSGHDIREWIQKAGPYIGHVHVHDNDGTSDQHRGIGAGSILFSECMEELKKYPREITWTIECQTRKDDLESYEKLKSLLA